MLKLGYLHCLHRTLTLLGRYGGVGGSWADALFRAHVQGQIVDLRARRMCAAMHRHLSSLPAAVHGAVLLDLHSMFVRECTPELAEVLDVLGMSSDLN